MAEDPGCLYKIIVGTDSQAVHNSTPDFVTALVVQRVGKGGRYFWRRTNAYFVHNLRERIIQEVLLSIEAANKLLELLRAHPDLRFEFELHIDVGDNGKTNTLIAEVSGIVRGYNYPFKTKPESYAASSVADKHV